MGTRGIFVALGLLVALTVWAERARPQTHLAAHRAPEPADHKEAESRTVIVIDPGHGGSNLGAPGVTDAVREKRVTLALARALRERLQDLGYAALMTRDRDEYQTLRQRVAHANEVDADLFLSLHANATPTHAQRGYETYVLSARGVDVDTRALRRGIGRPRPGIDPDVAAILDDVERGLAQDSAAALAARIQDRLGQVWNPADDRGVKQDAMHVLMGATMPAVLVEVGFVDHAVEGRQLLDPAMQIRIRDALTDAVRATLPPSRVAKGSNSR